MHIVNGKPVNPMLADQISVYDRGLLYGDGVFRTMRVSGGHILHWPRHYQKLRQDCTRLNITCPGAALLSEELQSLLQQHVNGIAKIIITRGQQITRGYRPTPDTVPTRILSIFPLYPSPETFYAQGIKLRVCQLRLAHQPQLAGIKHLNRLENVLAAAEWNDAEIAEGLMLDMADNVIEGTRSNLFAVRAGILYTPSLVNCGVAGIQRDRVIEWAAKHGLTCKIEPFGLTELLTADEIFLVNSLIGLWPVRELQTKTWSQFPVSRKIQEWLSHEDN